MVAAIYAEHPKVSRWWGRRLHKERLASSAGSAGRSLAEAITEAATRLCFRDDGDERSCTVADLLTVLRKERSSLQLGDLERALNAGEFDDEK
eukprot:1392634-Prymnesium_polylepis.2